MTYVVLRGPFHGPPESVVGPFDSSEAAEGYAQAQAGAPQRRFAAVMPLLAPESDDNRAAREADEAQTHREADQELGGEA